MHIIMGLGNDVFNELRRIVVELDEKETNKKDESQNAMREKLKMLYEELENIKSLRSNNYLAKMVIMNDLERIPLLLDNKIKEAEYVAKKNYPKHKSKRNKVNCDAEMCLLFPCDEENGWDESFKCINGCDIHVRCEGLVTINIDDKVPENYECESCKTGKTNKNYIKETLENSLGTIDIETHKIDTLKTKCEMQISKLEEYDSKCGPRQRKLKDAMKILNINPAKYHGGDFEGKAIQELLNCVRKNTFEILKCIEDKEKTYDKFKRALTTLREVSDSLRLIKQFDQEDIVAVKGMCEEWGKNGLLIFPISILPQKAMISFLYYQNVWKN